jgi:hypothetical protein
MPERLVLCSGAKRAGGNSTLRLALSGHSQNVTLKLEDISKRLVKNVPDLLTDEVVLFSGGLDSLSGAIEELSTDGKRVALVSHRSSPKIYDHQKASRDRAQCTLQLHAGLRHH